MACALEYYVTCYMFYSVPFVTFLMYEALLMASCGSYSISETENGFPTHIGNMTDLVIWSVLLWQSRLVLGSHPNTVQLFTVTGRYEGVTLKHILE